MQHGQEAPSRPCQPAELAEHLFRHETGKLVSVLTRMFGIDRLQLAEDVVQEALVRAMQTWPYYGIPDNPAAWITRTAKNLALKTLCGFNTAEIAKAFLTTEAAVAKRLTRARQRIREARIPFEIPTGDEVLVRIESVEQTLYLLFNEGYKASMGENLIREELCDEAIGLAALLAGHPVGNQPRTHALIALMLLNAARLPARVDTDGHILRLTEQDRSLWDRAMIARGMAHLAQSAAGEELSEYHLQAGIAACHCAAEDYASTDWSQILSLYDRLAELDDSPVVALNRAVAVAQVHGPKAGIEAVEAIPKRAQLFSYHLLYAVLGDFESRLNDHEAAANHFRRALELTEVKSERLFLLGRLRDSEEQRPRTPSA